MSTENIRREIEAQKNRLSRAVDEVTRLVEYANQLQSVSGLINTRRNAGLWRWAPITLQINPAPNASLRVTTHRPISQAGGLDGAAEVWTDQALTIEIQQHIAAIADLITAEADRQLARARRVSVELEIRPADKSAGGEE